MISAVLTIAVLAYPIAVPSPIFRTPLLGSVTLCGFRRHSNGPYLDLTSSETASVLRFFPSVVISYWSSVCVGLGSLHVVVLSRARLILGRLTVCGPVTISVWCSHLQCESKKNPPYGFLKFFPKRLGILNQFLHTYYTIISTLDYKFLFKYLQLWQSYAILSATT